MDSQLQMTEDECPVCKIGIPLSKDGSTTAKEAHIASCIESRITHVGYQTKEQKIYAKRAAELERSQNDENKCPVCYTSLLSKEFDGNEAARHAHVASCLERNDSSSTSQPQYAPPTYERPANLRNGKLSKGIRDSKSFTTSSRSNGDTRGVVSTSTVSSLQSQEDRNYTLLLSTPTRVLIVL